MRRIVASIDARPLEDTIAVEAGLAPGLLLLDFPTRASMLAVDLPLRTLQRFSKVIRADVGRVLTPEGSVGARRHRGGTAPAQVKAAVARARRRLRARP